MAATPVHFFSHGSTMMLGEESNSATYWKKCGDEALANGVKHIVIMVRQYSYLINVLTPGLTTITGSTLGHAQRRD